MKKVIGILVLIGVLIIPSLGFAQGNLSLSDVKNYADATIENAMKNVSSSVNMSVTAGEALTAGDVCKIVNNGGMKAYKFLSSIPSGNPFTGMSESVFNSANTGYISAIPLSSTQFVVCYQDYGNNYYGTAIVGTVSGITVTYGSEYVFYNESASSISVTALSSTQIVICYNRGISPSGEAVVGTVSGTSITFGSKYVFNNAATTYASATALSSTQFVVCYQDNGNSYYGTAVVGTVSGTSISYGSEYVFNSASAGSLYMSAIPLSSSQFVVCYQDDGNSNYGTAIVGTVSGTSISYGSEYVFNSAYTEYISATALSSTQFVVGYTDGGNSSYGTAIIGTVSGTSITFGSEYVFNSGTSYYTSATSLSSTQFVIGYMDYGNSYYGTAIVGTVSGTSISYGSEYVFNSAQTYPISVTVLSSTQFVVSYKDAGNSNYGTSIVGSTVYSGNIIPAFAPSAVASGSTGSFKLLTPGLKLSGLSGLTAFTPYYLNSSSQLSSTVNANYYMGTALSATELLVEGTYPDATSSSLVPISLQKK